MSQFQILSLQFNFDSTSEQSTELSVIVDNPDEMQLSGVPEHSVPDDVEIVAPDQTPTQEFWVYANHHHLTITLELGAGDNLLEVLNTAYYNQGSDPKPLDIVIAEKKGDGKKKTRKIRRDGLILSD